MKRYFESLRARFEEDFDRFLRFVIQESGCDRFTVKHFRYYAGG